MSADLGSGAPIPCDVKYHHYYNPLEKKQESDSFLCILTLQL